MKGLSKISLSVAVIIAGWAINTTVGASQRIKSLGGIIILIGLILLSVYTVRLTKDNK